MKKRGALEVLRHSRHDWLNRLQLIKGNISLERWDRVNNLIDEIVLEANHESNLTNLQAPLLAEFLITFHWEPRVFSFEYEVIGERLLDLSRYDQHLYEWISSLFTLFSTMVNRKAENHLFLSMQIEDKEVRFFFELSGIIEEKDKVSKLLEEEHLPLVLASSDVTSNSWEIQFIFSAD